MATYYSAVERIISAAHRNGPPGHKCTTNHGHEWTILVEYRYKDSDLNEYGWGPDFGKIKAAIDKYDHQDLNELLDVAPSAENFAAVLYADLLQAVGIAPNAIQISEGKGNKIFFDPVGNGGE